MAKSDILPSTLNMNIKKYYSLPVHQTPILPSSEIPPCSSPMPCTEPESSGDDQIESDSLGEQVDGQEEERWEISLVVWPDMTEKIPLERA